MRSSARRMAWPIVFFTACAAILIARAVVARSIVAGVIGAIAVGFVIVGVVVAIEGRGKDRAIVAGDEALRVPRAFRDDAVIPWGEIDAIDDHARLLVIRHGGVETSIAASAIGDEAFAALRALVSERLRARA